MVIGFWISLLIYVMTIIIFITKYSNSFYLKLYEKIIFELLIGISLFFMLFCGYYANIFG